EAFNLFVDMMVRIRQETVAKIFWIQMAREDELEKMEERRRQQRLVFNLAGAGSSTPQPSKSDKVGRNDPCPCGSGKKHKKCCGQ
ncbi:MAG TPA: SEC-C metal-binding domain-containing protein, partial [Geobacterales bacterium]|nr:SEC-C metal-binding domain-containing protein [Geobacterales bacterium]